MSCISFTQNNVKLMRQKQKNNKKHPPPPKKEKKTQKNQQQQTKTEKTHKIHFFAIQLLLIYTYNIM